MRLVAAQAAPSSGSSFETSARIDDIRNRMPNHRMPLPIFQRQNHHFVLLEIICWQPHCAAKNRQASARLYLPRDRVWSMAFQAERVPLRTQQFFAFPTMRFVAGAASLRKRRLVMHGLFLQIRNIRVATQANVHRIRLRQTRTYLLACGLWQSVQSPIAPGCGTLALSICLAFSSWHVTQMDFASACVSTTFPSFAGAWHTSHCLSANGGCMIFHHQFRRRGLVRIVALHAIRCAERLILVRLLQSCVLRIVAINAQRRRRLVVK